MPIPLPSKLTLTTLSSPAAFSAADAAAILTSAKTGEVQVVTAAPGQGKSTKLREEIAARMKAGTLTTVLWAVQSIRDKDSLGREALDHFDTLSVDAEIVYSRNDCASIAIHDGQMNWPGTPVVKIVSHARLPMIFGGGLGVSTGLKAADLLVIDEDPSGGMLLASATEPPDKGSGKPDKRLILSELAKGGDPVCVALAGLADRVERGPLSTLDKFGTFVFGTHHFNKGYGVFGEHLLSHLAALHPVDDLSLAKALSDNALGHAKLSPETAAFVATAFAKDVARAATGPRPRSRARFGLHWSGSKPLKGPGLLRFNLRPPLTFELPVIVLDGYADARYYGALFREQAVVFHTFDPGPKLDVEYDARLRLDPTKDNKDDGRQRRKLVAEELAKQRAARPGSEQLVLLNKVMQDPGSEWHKLITSAFADHPAKPTLPAKMHWHAGRGRNDQAGSDVYALSAPFLSPMYELYTLAGVFPSDFAERGRLKEHAQATELLQMLNRGRQPDPSFAASKPRIILGLSEEAATKLLGHLAERVVLRPYKFLSRIEKGSKNVRWCEMMILLVGELLDHFPDGVPLELIGALPKYHRKTQKQLKAVAALEALALHTPPESHLYRTFHDPDSWPYQDVHPGGGSSNKKMMLDVIAALNLRAKAAKPEVYLPDGASESAAWDAYKKFKKTGATALYLPTPAPSTSALPTPTLP